MNEKLIEKKLREGVKKSGGKSYKFVSPGNRGVFDRIVIMPTERMWFVELKSTGRPLTALQQYFRQEVTALGFKTRVIDDQQKLDNFLDELNDDL